MIRAGVIGYGYWGPNLVRNLAEVPGCEIVGVSDLRPERLALVRQRFPGVHATSDAADLIDDPRVDAILIATPLSAHYELALRALRAGKHVLVEKPLAASSDQAARLIDEAESKRVVLMVDHTFAYTSAVEKIRELVGNDGLGTLYYYDSVRVNLGLFQSDVNVVWDLAVHDLSIMDFVLPTAPQTVSATGMSHIGSHANIAYLTLGFEQSLIAHVHVNWLAPVKIRQTLIGGSRKMIVYDDVEPSEKLKIYDKGVDVVDSEQQVHQALVSYRLGDVWAPRLAVTEALQTELRHFVHCIETQGTPRTDGHSGLRVIRVLEAACQSMNEEGRPVALGAARAS